MAAQKGQSSSAEDTQVNEKPVKEKEDAKSKRKNSLRATQPPKSISGTQSNDVESPSVNSQSLNGELAL